MSNLVLNISNLKDNTIQSNTSSEKSNIIQFPAQNKYNEDTLENPLPLMPANESVEYDEIAVERDAQPIKNVEDVIRIFEYFIDKKKYRDYMLFAIGINTGLRCSDLLRLRFYDLINEDFTFKKEIVILEKKTRKTRKIKKNRHITINNAVKNAVRLYVENSTCALDDYLFRSQSNNGNNINKPMARYSVQRVIEDATNNLNIDVRTGTHCMRKTFAYHFMKRRNNDDRALHLLQKMFNHSTTSMTRDYIGLTGDEFEKAYLDSELGLINNFIDSDIYDTEA